MRILYVHQYFATPRGSTGTRSYEQARLMASAGHDVTVLTSPAQLRPEQIPPGDGVVRRGRIDGISCIVVDVPYHQTMGYARRIRSFVEFMTRACRIAIREPGVELVYATSTPLTVGIVALVALWLRSIPYAFEVRDLWPDVPLAMGILRPPWVARPLKVAERTIYRNASLLVAVNEDVGRAMLDTADRDVPLVVAPNACDLELFGPGRGGAAFRRRHGLEEKILCIHSGAMGRVNDLDSVLDAAAALRRDERLRFVLIGEGGERARLERRIERESLTNVLLMTSVSKTELADILAGADIGLMTVRPVPILELNCANKFFDYLASGLPVVLNYGGWQARVLADAGCGLSAPQGDVPGFVGAIERLAGDASLRQAMKDRARRLAETHFDRRQIVGTILDGIRRFSRGQGRASRS